MSCNNTNQFAKSAQAAYNNSTQAITAVGVTTIAILGNKVCDTGCSITTNTSTFNVLKSGLYRFSFDITLTATTAGTAIVQMYNGTVALPCAVAQVTADADSAHTTHIETVLPLNSCCGVRPAISVGITGVAGSVTHVCGSAVRLA